MTETGKELVAHLKETNACLGTKALVGHHSKFNPYAVATAETIASGSLGNIIGVNGLWTLLKPMRYFDLEWRRTKDAGPVLIKFIHDVDLLQFFFGPIVRIQADKTISQRGFEAEGVAIIFIFASGILGTFFLCDNVVSPFNWEHGTGDSPQFPHSGQDF